ncbi:hypothetical protein GASC598I20_000950 [Gilliamella apicola SCGC AB-598-I20]|nr:hypothetical protein GASC598I20_000950 [Gilliamella apicola SCGC AB-598-I20]
MKATKSRYFVLVLLFIVTAINYMDRANLSVAGTSIQAEFSLTPAQLGLLFFNVYLGVCFKSNTSWLYT